MLYRIQQQLKSNPALANKWEAKREDVQQRVSPQTCVDIQWSGYLLLVLAIVATQDVTTHYLACRVKSLRPMSSALLQRLRRSGGSRYSIPKNQHRNDAYGFGACILIVPCMRRAQKI